MPAESHAGGGQPLEPDPGNTGGGKRTRHGPGAIASSRPPVPLFGTDGLFRWMVKGGRLMAPVRTGVPVSRPVPQPLTHQGAVKWRTDETGVGTAALSGFPMAPGAVTTSSP